MGQTYRAPGAGLVHGRSARRAMAVDKGGSPDHREAARRQRRADWMVGLLVGAAFGPYTGLSGVRTEQLAAYGLLAVAVLLYIGVRPRLSGATWLIAALFLSLTATAALADIYSPPRLFNLPSNSVVAGFDNLFMPLAVLVVGSVAGAIAPDTGRLLRVALHTTVILLCANTVLAYLSSRHDLSGWLAAFWTQGGSSVAERAAEMGRFSGVFNQPAEAGLAYGIALAGATYLYRRQRLLLVLSATLLTVGGLFTVSKIFLLIALPVGMWQLLRTSKVVAPLVMVSVTAVVVVLWLTGTPIGGASLGPLLRPTESTNGVVDLYTAGRFGPEATLAQVTDLVFQFSPVVGFGAGGIAEAYDNGWVEALVMAGLIGAGIYTGILAVLVFMWFRLRHRSGRATQRLYGGLVLLVVGGSVGLPALTANRAATIFWLLIGLLLSRSIVSRSGEGG